MLADPEAKPTAVLLAAEVNEVSAVFPIAVLFPPETVASKALYPRTVLPEIEFAPLPTFILFIVPSKGKAGAPARLNKFT